MEKWPFANLSGDPDQDYFADGLTEDVIAQLARFRSLFVICSTSSFAYKDQTPKVQDVGRELAPDILDLRRLILVGERRRAADHEQGAEPRKLGDHVLGQTVGEVVLIGVAAEVGERPLFHLATSLLMGSSSPTDFSLTALSFNSMVTTQL